LGSSSGALQAVQEFRADSRLYGSYPETTFEVVVEANRRGTWTINALTGEVESGENHMYGDAAH